jgi:hypothetical protein
MPETNRSATRASDMTQVTEINRGVTRTLDMTQKPEVNRSTTRTPDMAQGTDTNRGVARTPDMSQVTDINRGVARTSDMAQGTDTNRGVTRTLDMTQVRDINRVIMPKPESPSTRVPTLPLPKGTTTILPAEISSSMPKGMKLGMAYVPFQRWEEPYTEEKGMARGTLFASLDLPFERDGGING